MTRLTTKSRENIKARDKNKKDSVPDRCFLDPENRRYKICPEHQPSITCEALSIAKAKAIACQDEDMVYDAHKKQEVFMCGSRKAYQRDREIMLNKTKPAK